MSNVGRVGRWDFDLGFAKIEVMDDGDIVMTGLCDPPVRLMGAEAADLGERLVEASVLSRAILSARVAIKRRRREREEADDGG